MNLKLKKHEKILKEKVFFTKKNGLILIFYLMILKNFLKKKI